MHCSRGRCLLKKLYVENKFKAWTEAFGGGGKVSHSVLNEYKDRNRNVKEIQKTTDKLLKKKIEIWETPSQHYLTGNSRILVSLILNRCPTFNVFRQAKESLVNTGTDNGNIKWLLF